MTIIAIVTILIISLGFFISLQNPDLLQSFIQDQTETTQPVDTETRLPEMNLPDNEELEKLLDMCESKECPDVCGTIKGMSWIDIFRCKIRKG